MVVVSRTGAIKKLVKIFRGFWPQNCILYIGGFLEERKLDPSGWRMKIYLIADTHFKHEKMRTYCDRPSNFTEVIIKNCHNLLKQKDLVIHLGDVAIGKSEDWDWIIPSLPGRWILIRGNHDRQKSCTWWMEHGFSFACDGMKFRGMWLTHEPSTSLADGCELNIHGHLHNIWNGFLPNQGKVERADMWQQRRLKNPWQRLFAIEYTNYMPIEFDKFVSHPDKFQSRGTKCT